MDSGGSNSRNLKRDFPPIYTSLFGRSPISRGELRIRPHSILKSERFSANTFNVNHPCDIYVDQAKEQRRGEELIVEFFKSKVRWKTYAHTRETYWQIMGAHSCLPASILKVNLPIKGMQPEETGDTLKNGN